MCIYEDLSEELNLSLGQRVKLEATKLVLKKAYSTVLYMAESFLAGRWDICKG